MYYLTACLIFRDAASYLEEWLRFHLLVGVEHFYLYDNDSRDDYLSVIRPFCAEGKVTVTRWPGPIQQLNVYADCLQKKFLFPANDATLLGALSPYENYAGVAACWMLFGSDGHRTRPPNLVTQDYRRRGDWVDQHVKCIVNPAKVSAPAVVAHSFHCLPGEVIVDENRRPTTGAFSSAPSAGVLCLNHYVIKSREEMVKRRTRRQADAPCSAHSIEKWEWFDSYYNTVLDLRIQRFAAQLGEHPASNQAMERTADRCTLSF